LYSVGYACLTDGRSAKESLSAILADFNESRISELKRNLIGQFILIIKKGDRAYIFSDFMGSRNIFYSQDNEGAIVASSFQKIEKLISTSPTDLDFHKVLEFLAVKHVLYPAWLGTSTMNRRIHWLRPCEYIAIDLRKSDFKLGTVTYEIDNRKSTDLLALSRALVLNLSTIINRDEFNSSQVAATLTGGRDSRLVAAVTASTYANVHFRTAVSANNYDSLMDSKVAEKIARISGIPYDRLTKS
jgi:asparagine synthetase B (glutamine-hydrolysing)